MRPSASHDSASGATPGSHRSRHEVSVVAPYRLDLTVTALRRLSMNVVDVLTPDGQYLRAFNGAHGPVIARVVQAHPEALAVTIDGDGDEHPRTLALLRRMLGTDRDLSSFNRAADQLPWLRPLARRMRGVKPPRYPTLWEAFVNAIIFQQVSLQAASAIARRVIVACGTSITADDVPLYLFPSATRVLAAKDGVLRAAGLSAGKCATLRRAGEALLSGRLDEAVLERHSSADAAGRLQQIKGIGPWTATVVLLRGLGRLDVFPMNDTSVARNFALVAGAAPLDVARVIETLRPQQGMLYYHLLLARLETRREVGRAAH